MGSRLFWLPILIATPLGLVVNLLSSQLSIVITVTLIIVSIPGIAVYAFADKISNWLASRNRTNRNREITKIKGQIAYIEDLKNDTARLISRIAVDLVFLIFSGFIIVLIAI